MSDIKTGIEWIEHWHDKWQRNVSGNDAARANAALAVFLPRLVELYKAFDAFDKDFADSASEILVTREPKLTKKYQELLKIRCAIRVLPEHTRASKPKEAESFQVTAGRQLTCTACGWVHIALPKSEAVTSEACFRCGASNGQMRPTAYGDCPDGSTIQAIVDPDSLD